MDINTVKIDDNQYRFDVLNEYVAGKVDAVYYIEHEGDDEWQLISEWGVELGLVSFSSALNMIEIEVERQAELAAEDYYAGL